MRELVTNLGEDCRNGEEAPYVGCFDVRGLGEALRDLLVEGVEHEERRDGHHDAQFVVLQAAEKRRDTDQQQHDGWQVNSSDVDGVPPAEHYRHHQLTVLAVTMS